MPKKVSIEITSRGGESRTTSTLDFLSDIKAPLSVKKKIKNDVGDFLIDTVLESVASSRTPVSGEGYKKTLSKKYKKRKREFGASTIPNMELTGDMLDAFKFERRRNGIEIGWFNKEANKADGHLHFSGRDSFAPRRRFLPGTDQKFKRNVESEIQRIVAEHLDAEN